MYTAKHVAIIYNISNETVRTWSEEFSQYLSATANPGKGRHRAFSDDDMGVLSLISEMKSEGKTFEDIHAALKNGSRGDAPNAAPEEVQALVVSDQEKRLTLEVRFLQRELEALRGQAERGREVYERNIQLEQELKDKAQQLEYMQSELSAARQKIEELSKEVGEAYVKGAFETMDRLNKKE
jgi:DNA-binding transcriptional MerR regulator